MTPNRLAAYKKKLLELDNRLDSEIDEITNELASGGMAAGEHDMHVREYPDVNVAIGRNEEAIQRDARAALSRIELGTYGICVDCGEAITKARLDALPYTPFCIKCETKHETS